jgi:hypothetical protein
MGHSSEIQASSSLKDKKLAVFFEEVTEQSSEAIKLFPFPIR